MLASKKILKGWEYWYSPLSFELSTGVWHAWVILPLADTVHRVIHTDAKVYENRKFLLTPLPSSTVLLLVKKMAAVEFHKKWDRLSSTFPYCTGHFSWCTGRFHTMYKSGKKRFKYVCGKSMGRGNSARLWPLVLMFLEIHTDSSWELSGKTQLNLFLLITYKVCMICLLCVLGLETLVSKSSGRLHR